MTAGLKATCEADAAGAVDGIVNEPWGFHTDIEQSPWWQVDLQAPLKLDRVVALRKEWAGTGLLE